MGGGGHRNRGCSSVCLSVIPSVCLVKVFQNVLILSNFFLKDSIQILHDYLLQCGKEDGWPWPIFKITAVIFWPDFSLFGHFDFKYCMNSILHNCWFRLYTVEVKTCMILTYFQGHAGHTLTCFLQFAAILPLTIADSKLDTIELA